MRTGSGENIILIGMPTAGKSTVGVVLKPGQTVDGLYRERVGLSERYADLIVDESGKHFEDVVRAVLRALGEAPGEEARQ